MTTPPDNKTVEVGRDPKPAGWYGPFFAGINSKPLRDEPLLPQLKPGDKVKLVLADHQCRELPCGMELVVVDTAVSGKMVALAYGAIERWVPNDGRVQPWK